MASTDVLHLYALTSTEPPAELGPGIDDHAVLPLVAEPFHALVSEHERRPATTQEAALAHAAVVDRALHLVATLPVRFGSTHADVAGLRCSLAASRDELVDALARVGRHVEFAARMPVPVGSTSQQPAAAGSPSQVSGRSYLEGQLARQREVEADLRVVERRLTAATGRLTSLATSVRTIRTRNGPERCFLVSLDRLDAAERAAAELSADGAVRVTGPFPPFSFAGGSRP